MTNGRIDDAQVQALLCSPPEEQLRYLVTFAVETRLALDDLQSRRRLFGDLGQTVIAVAAFLGAIGVIIEFLR